MKKVKLADLWQDIDDALSGSRAAGVKYAVLDAHKVLEHTLSSHGYPGRTIEKKLYWAGYSLEDDNGIRVAIEKRNQILNEFDFELSDLEASDMVSLYKKVVHEIVRQDPFGNKEKMVAFYKVYLSPKSVYTWRNLAIAFSFFLAVKVLNYTTLGKSFAAIVLSVSDLALSWVTVAAVIVVIIGILMYTNYRDNKTKIKIKE